MADETDHGIAAAFYSNGPSGYQPVMECSCGWTTGRELNWEDAGAAFDEHLTEVTNQ